MPPTTGSDPRPIPCLLGATGTGKSDVAIALARRLSGEIVCCDALTVYRRVRVLTAKPTPPADVPHHLLDVIEPWESYSAASFARDADRLVTEIRARGRTPIVTGGTALYFRLWSRGFGPQVGRDARLRAELEALASTSGPRALHARLAARDPARAAQLHEHDVRRLVRAIEIVETTGRPASALREEWDAPLRHPLAVLGLRRSPSDLEARIAARARRMLAEGLLEEVRGLDALERPPSPELSQAIGLEDARAHLRGEIDLPTLLERLVRATRRFSKRQATFYRQFPETVWLDVASNEPPDATSARCAETLAGARDS